MKIASFSFSLFLVLALQALPGHGAPQGARLEPYIGFKSAAFSSKEQLGGVGVNLESPMAGGLTGFRLGGLFTESFGLGIEFAYGYLEQNDDRWVTKDLGLYLEHRFTIPLRTWFTYYFSAEAESSSLQQLGSRAFGRGAKFGIGYTGFHRMSLNVEYLSLKYDDLSPQARPEADVGSILLSISSPLEI